VTSRPVLDLAVGDILRLRRGHPCGAREWTVDRLGADIGLRCSGCGRHVLIERRQLETRLDAVVGRADNAVDRPGPGAPIRPS
jgi:hypothetical protein